MAGAADKEMSCADDARGLTIALEGCTYGHDALVAGIHLTQEAPVGACAGRS